jgi:hypothetical protein
MKKDVYAKDGDAFGVSKPWKTLFPSTNTSKWKLEGLGKLSFD